MVRRGLVAPALCAVVSAALAVTAVVAVPAAPRPAVVGTPLAPALSPRRAPDLLARTIADARLGARLEAVVDDPRLGLARQRSCLVVRQGGRTVFERRPEDLLTPASNLKILTAVAVLRRLGPDARFTTEVRAAAPPRDGVVDGPLHLVGGGDPLLATADYAAHFPNQPQLVTALETLADRVRDAGVVRVRGGIVGDESRYDTQRYVPTWAANYITDAETGAQSALVVNDTFVTWRPRPRAASSPATHAAGVLASLLAARGVTVEGPPSSGPAPSGAVPVAAVESPPMAQIVAQMLRESDNMTAELLVKELGYRFRGRGTTVDGIAVMRATLQTAGLPVTDVENVDGSGLDRSDKATCRVLVEALTEVPVRELIDAGLPVAGSSGTLAMRFTGHPAAGRVRAKTGSLNYVTGLSGWADVGLGEDVAFAFLANELPDRVSTGRALQERIAAALVAYPEAPPPALLEPGGGT